MVAFHSVSWLLRDPGEGAKDGEIDFVLATPTEPIVCLEVKGGKLACDHGQWKRYATAEWERAKDPFTQALDHRYNLSRLIDTVDGWRGRDLLIVHAVAFPDMTVQAALAPDGPREILIDSGDMRALPRRSSACSPTTRGRARSAGRPARGRRDAARTARA